MRESTNMARTVAKISLCEFAIFAFFGLVRSALRHEAGDNFEPVLARTSQKTQTKAHSLVLCRCEVNTALTYIRPSHQEGTKSPTFT